MKIIKRTRLGIWRDLLDKNIKICFADAMSHISYCYLHDEFYSYLKADYPAVLDTKSWLRDGRYNWIYVPEKHLSFLEKFKVKGVPSDIKTSLTRDYRPDERIKDLINFREKHGHCYYMHDGYEESWNPTTQGFVVGRRQLWSFYNDNDPDHNKEARLDNDEVAQLREIGFIFETKLSHYFKKENKKDRQYLIDVLTNLDLHHEE